MRSFVLLLLPRSRKVFNRSNVISPHEIFYINSSESHYNYKGPVWKQYLHVFMPFSLLSQYSFFPHKVFETLHFVHVDICTNANFFVYKVLKIVLTTFTVILRTKVHLRRKCSSNSFYRISFRFFSELFNYPGNILLIHSCLIKILYSHFFFNQAKYFFVLTQI